MKKSTTYLLLGLLVVSIVASGFAVDAGLIMDEDDLFYFKPPSIFTTKEERLKHLRSPNKVRPMLVEDRDREFLLGYLEHFKNESLNGSESPEEAERITRKNELIQEYKDYVAELYGQTMTTEEYRSHYDHLMDLIGEMLPLEPEPTPQEQLLSKAKVLRSGLDDELTFSKRDEEYRQVCNIDLPMLKTLITHLKTLQKQIENGEITYEQSLQEYEKCLEELKIAHPGRYESVMNDDGE